MRQSVTRLEKQGYAASLRPLAELSRRELGELERVSRSWRGGQRPSAASAWRSTSCAATTTATVSSSSAATREGRIRGFLHFAPSYGRPAVSLSLMRRDKDTPNGLTEFLVARGIELLREPRRRGGLAQLRSLRPLHPRAAERPRAAGRQRPALADSVFQIERLHRFNAKFFPRWEPRYLLYERVLGLGRVGLAAMWLEGQLPKPTFAALTIASAES